MDITPEQRAAVLADLCTTHGHLPDIRELIGHDPDLGDPDTLTLNIRSRDADSLPHVSCQRCGWVWLISADGPSYDAAEDSLNEQRAPKNRVKPRREVRRERVAAEAEAAKERAAAAQVPAPPVAPAAAANAPAAVRPVPVERR